MHSITRAWLVAADGNAMKNSCCRDPVLDVIKAFDPTLCGSTPAVRTLQVIFT
jgi:hypothetical protein